MLNARITRFLFSRPFLFSAGMLALALPLQAYETDNFNLRDQLAKVPDATDAVNQETNRRLLTAVHDFNEEEGNCSTDLKKPVPSLFLFVRDYLRGDFAITAKTFTFGTFSTGLERYVESSKTFADKRIGPPKKSIYHRESEYDDIPIFLTVIGLQGSVRMGGGEIGKTYNAAEANMIGIDKFGHFFDQGYEYFEKAYDLKTSKKPYVSVDFRLNRTQMESAIQLGIDEEDGKFGKEKTGVKSYGDLSAQFQGMRFWTSLLKGPQPFVVCKNGRYEMNSHRTFDFRDYVSPAWDEGVNCSDFSPAMGQVVRLRIRSLGACPIDLKKCEYIAKLPCAYLNTSPDCAKLLKNVNWRCDQSEASLELPVDYQILAAPAGCEARGPSSVPELKKIDPFFNRLENYFLLTPKKVGSPW